jgi:hypothetical protein
MKEIVEIYLKSGTFGNKEEISRAINEIMQSDDGWNFEVIARYVCNLEGMNILVEIQVPTLMPGNCGHSEIEMVAYTYDGEMEDFMAESELESKEFDGQWETAIEQMKFFAYEVRECENCIVV